jgi:hypothetical protein
MPDTLIAPDIALPPCQPALLIFSAEGMKIRRRFRYAMAAIFAIFDAASRLSSPLSIR